MVRSGQALLLALLAAAASARNTVPAHNLYSCGAMPFRVDPCESKVRDLRCTMECHTTEFCRAKHGPHVFCDNGGTRGCCGEAPRWDKRRFDCSTHECNSHAYCQTFNKDSKCVNGCCKDGNNHFKSFRGEFKEYTCSNKPSATVCDKKQCAQECQTTQHCQKIVGPESVCDAVTSCCRRDTSYGHPVKPRVGCEAECQSHDFCSDRVPGATCVWGCCEGGTPRETPEEELTRRNVTHCRNLSSDIVLVIDASGSITAPIFNTHTKRFAKAIVNRFDVFDTRTRFGIVAYSANVYYTLPLAACKNVACLEKSIDDIKYAAQGTCTGDGIEAATEMLMASEKTKGRSRSIIVITDGHEECGFEASTVAAKSRAAREKDIELFAVAVGKTFSSTAAAIADLEAISGGEGGRRFVADNYEGLDQSFVERLQRQVCSTKPNKGTCFDTSNDCKRELCTSENKKTMIEKCTATCGYCDGGAPGPSVTTPPTTTAAPTTTTAGKTCVDTATDCGIKSGLCTNAAYKSLMLKRCQKTCGWC